jgi:cis-3-alkyl-4-acyloxetan-2-one decarboxylase
MHQETWIPFKRSLEHCIEQQTVLQDILGIAVPINAFYGTLDAVVVGENVRSLSHIQNVQLYTFRGNHKLGQTYANVVAGFLISDTTLQSEAGSAS